MWLCQHVFYPFTSANNIFCSLNIFHSSTSVKGIIFFSGLISKNSCTKYSSSTPNGLLEIGWWHVRYRFRHDCHNNTHLMLMNGRTWSTFLNNMLRNSSGSGGKRGFIIIREPSVINCTYLSHPCWLLPLFPNAPNSFSIPSQTQSEQHHSWQENYM